MKNNIFSYATGELSQDAFICWLMSYAMKDAENDTALRMCAHDFLGQFIPELSCEENIYISEIPQKQYKSIDVLLTVNEKYKVIIEDKTYTSEHDNQLRRYFDIVCEDYKNFTVKGVYFKTGFQSDLSAIKESGYIYFDRQAILKTIEKYADKTQNRIFRDYYEYLKNLNDEVEKFKTLPVEQWNWHQINGFYEYAKKNNKSDMNYNYGYVHNKDGGFYGMWMYNGTYKYIQDDKYSMYLHSMMASLFTDIVWLSSRHGLVVEKDLTGDLLDSDNPVKWLNRSEPIGQFYIFNNSPLSVVQEELVYYK